MGIGTTLSGRMGALALAGVAMFAASAAHAGTDTEGMQVSGTVVPRCTVTAQPLTFIVTNPGNPAPINSSATFTVDCTRLTLYVVSVNQGLYPQGGNRRMRAATGQYLTYNIYTNAARTNVWSGGYLGLSLGGGAQVYTAYGRIPNASAFSVAAGNYYDTLTVTVDF